MNIICIGLQFGDEGKGKVVDFLSRDAVYVVRFNGGNNTGCTVVTGGTTFALHHIPAGIISGKKSVLTPGMVLNPTVCCEEIEKLHKNAIETKGLLFISERIHLIFPHHCQADREEDQKRANPIGTTGRGIGYCYSDKKLRRGVRLIDALEKGAPGYEKELEILREYVCDTFALLQEASKKGENILFEGAQGSLLDIDYGTYPYVTSSNTIASNGCTGSGFSPRKIDKILGVAKVYTTRVGGGPFPTEIPGDEFLVTRGKEFGTTTGRKRRCGWLDLVALKYAVELNDADGLALTKIDILSGLDKIPLCTGYRYKGSTMKTFPASLEVLEHLEPIYEEMKGWKEEISLKKSLPVEARDYLKRIEDYLEVGISLLSLGPDREETLVEEEVWS